MKIAFVVDSGCDVPQRYIDQYNMHVVPLYINYGGESYGDDGKSFDRYAYYAQLPDIKPLPQTSAPSLEDARIPIMDALSGADHVICVSIAAGLSNTNNVMRLAAEEVSPDRVTIWDSETLSMGCGWQAIIGAETAVATGDLAETLAVMKRVRTRTTVYAAMASLEYLRRGGRVPWAAAAVGNFLRVRPIVDVGDGEVKVASRIRTHRAWLEKVISLTQALAPVDRIALLHTDNHDDVESLRERVSDMLPDTVLTVVASPVIGTHTGPAGIGVATVGQGWRD
ncbi:MAG: DegV family protein [Chloroflexota bacterium]